MSTTVENENVTVGSGPKVSSRSAGGAAVVKGGLRFSFNALVVVGNGRGTGGLGLRQGQRGSPGRREGVKDAHKQMNRVQLKGGRSRTR